MGNAAIETRKLCDGSPFGNASLPALSAKEIYELVLSEPHERTEHLRRLGAAPGGYISARPLYQRFLLGTISEGERIGFFDLASYCAALGHAAKQHPGDANYRPPSESLQRFFFSVMDDKELAPKIRMTAARVLANSVANPKELVPAIEGIYNQVKDIEEVCSQTAAESALMLIDEIRSGNVFMYEVIRQKPVQILTRPRDM